MKYGYVSVSLDRADAIILSSLIRSFGIVNPIYPNDLHVTLMYDERNPLQYPLPHTRKIFRSSITGFERLGQPGSQWEAIALTLDSDELEVRHDELSSMGFKHSYRDYVPHISIKYRPLPQDYKILEANLERIKERFSNILIIEEKWDMIRP